MKKTRFPLQDISRPLGMDDRLRTELFRRMKDTIMDEDVAMEVEHFGIFERVQKKQFQRHWQWQFQTRGQRQDIRLRSPARELIRKRIFKMDGCFVEFEFNSDVASFGFKLVWELGLLPNGWVYHGGLSVPYSGEAVGRARMGYSGTIQQFRIDSGFVQLPQDIERIVRIYYDGDRRDFTSPAIEVGTDRLRLRIQRAKLYNMATESIEDAVLDPRSPYHNDKNTEDTWRYDNKILEQMIIFMMTKRGSGNNTGPRFLDDLVNNPLP